VRLDGVAANDEKLFFAARTGDLATATCHILSFFTMSMSIGLIKPFKSYY
jgi:hypothetical protein